MRLYRNLNPNNVIPSSNLETIKVNSKVFSSDSKDIKQNILKDISFKPKYRIK